MPRKSIIDIEEIKNILHNMKQKKNIHYLVMNYRICNIIFIIYWVYYFRNIKKPD